MPTVSIVLVMTLTAYIWARSSAQRLPYRSVVAKLADQVENALNETRMLILGAQVLLGFDFEAAFQPGFERLPPALQSLKVGGLGVMLVAVGLLLAPGAFHQIVERGNDSPRLIAFTSRIATVALLPFAVVIGVDVYLAATVVLDPSAALSAGLAATVFALAMWYGIEWLVRWKRPPRTDETEDRHMTEGTDLDTRIKQVLTETRVVLPGAQALLGFQFTAVLTDAFATLPALSQYVHLASLGLIAISIMCLMAPAAFHRIVERGQDTERLHFFASAMVLCAMVPLAFGIAGDCYVVVSKVLQSANLALISAVLSLIFFFGLWFGVTAAMRLRFDSASRQSAAAISHPGAR